MEISRLGFRRPTPAGTVTVRLGEKLAADGTIDRPAAGQRELSRNLTGRPARTNKLSTPDSAEKISRVAQAVKMSDDIGEVTPFRYAELEGAARPARSRGFAPTVRSRAV